MEGLSQNQQEYIKAVAQAQMEALEKAAELSNKFGVDAGFCFLVGTTVSILRMVEDEVRRLDMVDSITRDIRTGAFMAQTKMTHVGNGVLMKEIKAHG